jgi:voltage-gated potassium channel Kch
LAIQPNVNNPQLLGLARTFGAGALLIGVALLASRYLLPPIFKRVAQVPELLLVISLGWCFLVALVAANPFVGLSMEMGALIAGISLATFPYNLDVVAKAVSIRDFFITLFFVALGMQIPLPNVDVIWIALGITAVALVVRLFGVFGVLYALKGGHRASLLATINLAQVSEFSLVILSLGIGLGHIEQDTLTHTIWVFALLAVASTYLITFSHPIQGTLSRLLTLLRIKDLGQTSPDKSQTDHHGVVLLGFYRIASALFEELCTKHPQIAKQVKVIDFNPEVKQKLDPLGVAYVYGDISHPDTLHHAGIHDAQLVVCSISDGFLRGTSNARLLQSVKGMAPKAKVIVTADTVAQTKELYAAGADYVLESSQVAGDWLASVIEQSLRGELPRIREAAQKDLRERQEVLA